MREIDPFPYYGTHASAISGFGGEHLSPDPRYCFHTHYIDVRPGPARFELQLESAHASHGELALRVHAVKTDSDESAILVSGARLELALDDTRDVRASVAFVAMRNVQYAFYGYFTEASDVKADGLGVFLHEFEGEVEDYVEPPRSYLALDQERSEVRPANALIHVITPHLAMPVSQDCTWWQMDELKSVPDTAPTIDGWAEALCLNALHSYGVVVSGLEGLAVGPCSDGFFRVLEKAGFAMMAIDAAPLPAGNSNVFADFMVWPEGLAVDPDGARRWAAVKAWFGRLKIGGVGVLTCRYRPETSPTNSNTAVEGPEITQNEIGKWALRLIGDGYSVAPLAFSSPEDLVLDSEGLARFAIIAKRH